MCEYINPRTYSYMGMWDKNCSTAASWMLEKLIIYNVHGYCALYGKEPSCSTAAGYGTLYIVRICISQYDMLGYSQVPHVFKEL